MGFRVGVLLRFVLLLSAGALCAAAQTGPDFNNNDTLNQTPEEPIRTNPQLPRSLPHTADHWSNQLQQSNPALSPMGYQLQNPAVRSHKQNLQGLNPEQLEPRLTVRAKKPVRSPDLNPIRQEPKVLVKFEQRWPLPADTVAVRCGEAEVTVEVKQNFLGNGQLIHAADLTLGGCVATDTLDRVLLFQAELQDCGSTKAMSKEALVYTFSLIYSPTPFGHALVLKTNPAEVIIECHYPRRHYVSSDALRPTWKPFASNVLVEQQLGFSLRLMTEDWQSERTSSLYYLSDVMYIEASVLQSHHIPLRVYVDRCVATVDPDPASEPRYAFINNHGCLTDAKLSGAKSIFMQRSQEDKLHFQLKTFRFYSDPRTSLFITCHLKATTVSAPVDLQHKACSFLTEANRWVASDGDNKVCGCCESSCSEQRRRRHLAADTVLEWEGTAALGPILLQENTLREELMELSHLPLQFAPHIQKQEPTQEALTSSMALLCGVGAALGVVLLVFLGAVVRSRLRKPAGHSICT